MLQKTNRMENYIEGTGEKNYIFYLKNRENNETEYFLINHFFFLNLSIKYFIQYINRHGRNDWLWL